ncbi:MAG: heme-dependent oxidative N-demethylase subunit alpha family protein [Fimbriimonadaceae bacterium]
MSVASLPAPARYAPWTRGIYDVAPALRPLGADFGNGSQDACLIQVDRDFARYRMNKEAAYADNRAKYFGPADLDPGVGLAVAIAIASHLAHDYPDHYRQESGRLHCLLTGDTVEWTPRGLIDLDRSLLAIPCTHLLEALAFQIEPDIAVVAQGPGGADRVAAVHVCAPSHWDPVTKLGQSFFETHTVVPGFDRINAAAPRMVDAMIRQGPFVRFVWGVESDDRLNHHPDPPEGWTFDAWNGRRFDRDPFWVRVERQTLLGLPDVGAALFVIHAKTVPAAEVLRSESEKTTLVSALQSMSPDARRYKGVDTHFARLLKQLES